MSSSPKLPPVIVLSVVTNPEVIREFRNLGVFDVLRKPVLPSELKQRVEDALKAAGTSS